MSEKDMSAKKMFEKLGYKQVENNANYIGYKYEFSDASSIYSTIRFYLPQQEIEFYYNDDILNSIAVEELQAINKQIEELGWSK